MIKLSSAAVKGFLKECSRLGFNEMQSAYLLERSIDTSDALVKSAEDWISTTKEKFFKKHPEARNVYKNAENRKDPKYAAFFAALDGKGGKDRLKVSKSDPYKFKFNIPGQK